jgi:hypothetical protein
VITQKPGIITQYIPDLVGDVVTNVATAMRQSILYEYGHYAEVERNLIEKDKSPIDKTKYPFIWLVMDFEEKMGTASGAYAGLSLQLIIATGTSNTYGMKERRDKSFLPVLYPIYSELLNQFSRSVVFGMPTFIEHTKIDRPYWGVQGGLGNGTANLFSDFIDAIQIKNLKVSVKRKVC